MEYKGLHLQQHHQLQEEYAHYYKPSTCQAWKSSTIYNNGYSSTINSRDVEDYFDFQDIKSIAQESRPSDDVLVSRIKDEVCDNYLLSGYSLNDFLISSTSTVPHPHQYSSHVPAREAWSVGSNYNFCHLHEKPMGHASSSTSSNLSTLEMPPSSYVSCSLGLNSQLMFLGGSTCDIQVQPSYDSFGLNEDSICLSHSSNMQDTENSSSNCSNKISPSISEVARTKIPRHCSPPKQSEANANKKPRPSCSLLKVRKEKLGDRIQTLQKLVAPFGKTNTASVLTEAIGYIHFLHHQIHTLSVPYMKSSQTKPFRMVQLLQDSKEGDSRKSKPDLRSRGLCLVPLSYASYIHNFD